VRYTAIGVYRNGLFVTGAMAPEDAFDFPGRIVAIFSCAWGSVTLVISTGAVQPSPVLVYIPVLGVIVYGALGWGAG